MHIFDCSHPAFSLRHFLKKNPDIQISIQNSGDPIKAGASHQEFRISTRLNPSGKRQGSERERTSVSKYSQVQIPPTSPENNPEAQFIMTLCVSGGRHVNLEGVNGKPVTITWFIPEDHLQNLKKRQMHVLFDVHIKIFPDFFWWLSARMIFILWTFAFYHIESSICRWYSGWEIFYPSGNRGPDPRAILPGAIQKTWMPIVGFPGFTGK